MSRQWCEFINWAAGIPFNSYASAMIAEASGYDILNGPKIVFILHITDPVYVKCLPLLTHIL
jgi:hypothetical protein